MPANAGIQGWLGVGFKLAWIPAPRLREDKLRGNDGRETFKTHFPESMRGCIVFVVNHRPGLSINEWCRCFKPSRGRVDSGPLGQEAGTRSFTPPANLRRACLPLETQLLTDEDSVDRLVPPNHHAGRLCGAAGCATPLRLLRQSFAEPEIRNGLRRKAASTGNLAELRRNVRVNSQQVNSSL